MTFPKNNFNLFQSMKARKRRVIFQSKMITKEQTCFLAYFAQMQDINFALD